MYNARGADNSGTKGLFVKNIQKFTHDSRERHGTHDIRRGHASHGATRCGNNFGEGLLRKSSVLIKTVKDIEKAFILLIGAIAIKPTVVGDSGVNETNALRGETIVSQPPEPTS